nr:anti-sigma factor RsbA family regulatory protein [uncultured Actinoplanes sp.]
MSAGPLHHAALLYRGAADYLAAATAFVRAALAAGNPVLVAVPGPRLHVLRDALADVAGWITFADMAVAGRNPGRLLPALLLGFAARHEGRRVSVLGEPMWAGRTELEHTACATHEALVNTVLAGRDAALLCPYDMSTLEPGVITGARHTHPVTIEGGVARRSSSYADPLATAAALDMPLPAVPPYARKRVFGDRAELSGVRSFVAAAAAGLLGGDRLDDLVLAANELVTNVMRYTRGDGRIALWTEPGLLVCQVDDDGPPPGPLAGRVPPGLHAARGRGLILVNELCDLVRLHRHPGGTSVRLHLATGGPLRAGQR